LADSSTKSTSTQAQQLRELIQADAYKPDLSLVAVSILRRPAIRELLLSAPR
jgi:hypothetical protein